mmetsp:Transcript_10940/g.28912  ORF Transcript_10940/g.28912 Transcript_10940/m.28912 type:complete len:227 (-) Transcript_10940:525-1205(-)
MWRWLAEASVSTRRRSSRRASSWPRDSCICRSRSRRRASWRSNSRRSSRTSSLSLFNSPPASSRAITSKTDASWAKPLLSAGPSGADTLTPFELGSAQAIERSLLWSPRADIEPRGRGVGSRPRMRCPRPDDDASPKTSPSEAAPPSARPPPPFQRPTPKWSPPSASRSKPGRPRPSPCLRALAARLPEVVSLLPLMPGAWRRSSAAVSAVLQSSRRCCGLPLEGP